MSGPRRDPEPLVKYKRGNNPDDDGSAPTHEPRRPKPKDSGGGALLTLVR